MGLYVAQKAPTPNLGPRGPEAASATTAALASPANSLYASRPLPCWAPGTALLSLCHPRAAHGPTHMLMLRPSIVAKGMCVERLPAD
jgi:hypothetical protein